MPWPASNEPPIYNFRVRSRSRICKPFTPKPEEAEWPQGFASTPDRRLALLLKCFQFLRHFPALEAIPGDVAYPALYLHHKAIRALLSVKPYTDAQTRALAIRIAQETAGMVETRVDIINITIEELVRLGYERRCFVRSTISRNRRMSRPNLNCMARSRSV